MGCIMAFVDDKTGWLGFGKEFEMTTDGGMTWQKLALPEAAGKIAAISLRTAKDGYLLDDNGVLYITTDSGTTWSSRSLGLESPDFKGFGSGPFINEIPQATMRFFDASHGLVVMGLEGNDGMIALRTVDGGATWNEENMPAGFGAPYLSPDGRVLAVNVWNQGVTLFKYE
jgi:photosystem II stability/assembly factor-like uncharacterized protein